MITIFSNSIAFTASAPIISIYLEPKEFWDFYEAFLWFNDRIVLKRKSVFNAIEQNPLLNLFCDEHSQ